ncbi:Uncharacterised protein [Vibrio vulnificus]|nr:Uncharacterised protein [Vibrio vulnificus]
MAFDGELNRKILGDSGPHSYTAPSMITKLAIVQ